VRAMIGMSFSVNIVLCVFAISNGVCGWRLRVFDLGLAIAPGEKKGFVRVELGVSIWRYEEGLRGRLI